MENPNRGIQPEEDRNVLPLEEVIEILDLVKEVQPENLNLHINRWEEHGYDLSEYRKEAYE